MSYFWFEPSSASHHNVCESCDGSSWTGNSQVGLEGLGGSVLRVLDFRQRGCGFES